MDVDAFGKTAETIGQYLKKGRPILIEGRLPLRNLGRQADQTEEEQTRRRHGNFSIPGFRQGRGGDGIRSPACTRPAAASAPAPEAARPSPARRRRRSILICPLFTHHASTI